MPERFNRDPFAITPDPEVYVPRAATEAARKELLRSACNPAKTTALIGPPGLGKTLLLHLLAQEAPEDMQTVYLPYAALPPAEVCAWALQLLDSPTAEDPIAALQALGENLRERGASLLIAIDDAGAMPIATARWAGELVQHSGGSVRLAVAASDNASGNRVIAAIGSNFDIVHLNDPMTEGETRKYIDGRLALARVPDSIRARFDDRIVRLLHRISAGIPRRLHSAAAEIMQEAPSATATTTTPAISEASDGEYSDARSASVDAPIEPVGPAQTLGVPSEERRESRRRAEAPEGVAMRVGEGGQSAASGRRAEDRIEPPPETSKPAAERIAEPNPDSVEKPAVGQAFEHMAEDLARASAEASAALEPVESEEYDDESAADWESTYPPTLPRRAPSPSPRTIVLGALLVALVAVAIPVIRSILSEPAQNTALEPRPDVRKPTHADAKRPMQADPRGAGEELEPADSAADKAMSEIAAAARGAESGGGSPAAKAPSTEIVGPLAVQINASPWAKVEVDGIDLGVTPLANIPLVAGAHSFRARMPDGRVIERTIVIDAERRFISFE
jgi:type II secretory pathway predicted ATPase ExeA